MKKVIVIDNYDSFTYNLVHILRELGLRGQMDIFRNDEFNLDQVSDYSCILLSPGPGVPKHAGLMPDVIQTFSATKNILGVCLGHQAIGESFGCELLNLPQVFHGTVTPIDVLQPDDIFHGIPKSFDVCRYHSWVIERESVTNDLEITSMDNNGHIMSIRHKQQNVRGIQFHPESIMTEHGKKLIENWLEQ